MSGIWFLIKINIIKLKKFHFIIEKEKLYLRVNLVVVCQTCK